MERSGEVCIMCCVKRARRSTFVIKRKGTYQTISNLGPDGDKGVSEVRTMWPGRPFTS